MPVIDVYAAAGTFVDKNKLAQDLANAVLKWEGVPSTDLFKKNTAAFVHELPSDAISNAAGELRQQAIEPWRTGLGYSSRNLRMVVGGSTAKRSRMQTLSPPSVRSWEIRKERRVVEKNPRSSSALRRWHECEQ